MKIYKDIKTLKQKINYYSSQRKSIGFIPTMGALHEGHLSLIQRARKENDIVIVTVFVNPKQFTNPSDLLSYPRTLERDTALIVDFADVLFSPSVEEMYPVGSDTTVEVGSFGKISEGIYRPGHFNGMATIVTKIFNIISPTRAYFGKKDYQQYLIVQKMVKDLNLEIEIVGCETVREISGLAMSSRNTRLSKDEREKARVIYRALESGKKIVRSGEKSVLKVRDCIAQVLLSEPSWKTEYIEIRSINDFTEVETVEADVVVLIAGYLGEVRLIDNIEICIN